MTRDTSRVLAFCVKYEYLGCLSLSIDNRRYPCPSEKAFVVQRIGIVVAGSLLLAVGVGGLAVTAPESAPSPASAVSEGTQR